MEKESTTRKTMTPQEAAQRVYNESVKFFTAVQDQLTGGEAVNLKSALFDLDASYKFELSKTFTGRKQ